MAKAVGEYTITDLSDGKGITSSVEYYLASDKSSGITYLSEGWSTSVPTISGTPVSLSETGKTLKLNNTMNTRFGALLPMPDELSQEGTPSPSTPVDIVATKGEHTITVSDKNNDNSQVKKISFGVINLFDINQLVGANKNNIIVDSNSYSFILRDNPTEGYISSGKTLKELCPKLVVGDEVILSFSTNSRSPYKDRIHIGEDWEKGTTKTITQTMLDATVSFYGGYNEVATIKELQIEEGTTVHCYSEYNVEPLEYCKIGNNEDIIFKNTPDNENYNSSLHLNMWYIKKAIGKHIFNGSEEFVKSGIQYNVILNNSKASGNLLSNYFVNNDTIADGNMYIYQDGYLRICKESTDLNDFKTWLSNNNITVYYVLKIPEYVVLPNTMQKQLNELEKTKQYETQTNILSTIKLYVNYKTPPIKYLWNYTEITYTDSSIIRTSPAVVGVASEDLSVNEEISKNMQALEEQIKNSENLIEAQSSTIASLQVSYDAISSSSITTKETLDQLSHAILDIKGTISTQTDEAITSYFIDKQILDNPETGDLGILTQLQNGLNGVSKDLTSLLNYITQKTVDVDGKTYPCLEIATPSSQGAAQVKIQVLPQIIRFVEGNSITAYISNNELYINENTVLTRQQIGKEGVGKWITELDSIGNLNTYWGGKS